MIIAPFSTRLAQDLSQGTALIGGMIESKHPINVESIEESIGSIASAQFGLITRDQALEAGLSVSRIKYRLKSGRWERVGKNVYRLSGTVNSWEQRLMAAWLAAGPLAAVSHRSAGALLGITPATDLIELTVPPNHPRRATPEAIVHRGRHFSTCWVGPFRVVEPNRTLVDLASVLPPIELEDALDTALRLRKVHPNRLLLLIGTSGQGRDGVALLKSLDLERQGEWLRNASTFEDVFYRLLRKAKIRLPVSQHSVFIDGKFVARLDFAYPDKKIAIECDSWSHHGGKRPFEEDRRKSRALVRAGWTVLRFTWSDVINNPQEVIAAIRDVLEQR